MENTKSEKSESAASGKKLFYTVAAILAVMFLIFDIKIGSFGKYKKICSRCGREQIKKSFLFIPYSTKITPTEVTNWLEEYSGKEHEHNWFNVISKSKGFFTRGMHGHGHGRRHFIYFRMIMRSDLPPKNKKELYEILQSENRDVINGFSDIFFKKLDENQSKSSGD